ncbi:hypothetical protein JCM10213_003016 [Rhodosporidiobolus nylandii]
MAVQTRNSAKAVLPPAEPEGRERQSKIGLKRSGGDLEDVAGARKALRAGSPSPEHTGNTTDSSLTSLGGSDHYDDAFDEESNRDDDDGSTEERARDNKITYPILQSDPEVYPRAVRSRPQSPQPPPEPAPAPVPAAAAIAVVRRIINRTIPPVDWSPIHTPSQTLDKPASTSRSTRTVKNSDLLPDRWPLRSTGPLDDAVVPTLLQGLEAMLTELSGRDMQVVPPSEPKGSSHAHVSRKYHSDSELDDRVKTALLPLVPVLNCIEMFDSARIWTVGSDEYYQ